MRQYIIDELKREEVDAIRSYLEEQCEPSGIDGLYWLRIPDDLLSGIQVDHKECAPFYFAAELGDSWLKLELLVRTRERLRCQCIQHATQPQRDFLLNFADTLVERLEIKA